MQTLYDDQYPDMNVGAQKRPASIFGAPAIVWHRAFWKPTEADGWENKVDHFLYLLFRMLMSSSSKVPPMRCPNFDYGSQRLYLFRNLFDIKASPAKDNCLQLNDTLRVARHDVFTVSGWLNGAQYSVRSELHTEYVTLTIITDFSDTSGAVPALRKISDALSRLAGIANERYGAPNPPAGANRKSVANAGPNPRSDIIDAYRKHWEGVLSRLAARPEDLTALGSAFAEFFGVVLRSRIDGVSPDDPLGRLVVNPTRETPPPPGTQRRSPLTDLQAYHLVRAVWPIIRGLARPRIQRTGQSELKLEYDNAEADRYTKPEYVATRFQDANALYISSLGELAADTLGTDHREPVIYLLIANYRSRWQIGRLADRLNTMGTLRLAAVRDLVKLTNASAGLRKIQNDLTVPIPALPLAIERANGSFDYIDRSFSNGLGYRISRSEYYVKGYEAYVSQLREKRIEGYQSYSDFVRRRLYDTFEFISTVGARRRDVRGLIQAKEDLLRTASMLDVARKIQEANRNLEERQSDTVGLLRTAEWIIAAPLAYYVTELSKKVLPSLFPGVKNHPYWFFALFGLGAVISVVLYAHHQREADEKRRAAARESQAKRAMFTGDQSPSGPG